MESKNHIPVFYIWKSFVFNTMEKMEKNVFQTCNSVGHRDNLSKIRSRLVLQNFERFGTLKTFYDKNKTLLSAWEYLWKTYKFNGGVPGDISNAITIIQGLIVGAK